MKRLILFLLASIALAQTATVIDVPADEARVGLRLHDAMVKADNEYNAWAMRQQNVYTGDWEFTPDFRHMVPKVASPINGNSWLNPLICHGCTTLPATSVDR